MTRTRKNIPPLANQPLANQPKVSRESCVPPPEPSPDLSGIFDNFNPVAFAQALLGFNPDPPQTRILLDTAECGILNCTRQFGKSTVCSVKALHHMETHPDSLVLVITPSDRQSREFVRKTARFVRKLGHPVRGDGDNPVSLQLPNGSRMVGLPCNESTIRGFSEVSLLLVDEAAQVPDELYLTVRPMVAVSKGTIWLMSTPKGRRGFFYNTWISDDPDWTRIAVPATECPRIPAKFLKQEERIHGARSFRQEYLCEFVGDNQAIFDEDLVRSLIRSDVPSYSQRFQRPGYQPPQNPWQVYDWREIKWPI